VLPFEIDRLCNDYNTPIFKMEAPYALLSDDFKRCRKRAFYVGINKKNGTVVP
jgi:hypothetical protein